MKSVRTGKRRISRYVIVLLTILVMAVFLFPIYIALITSFKTPMEIAESILALPKKLSLSNYIEGMRKSNFTKSLFNSVIVTFPSVAMIVIFSSMGGYTIARYSKKILLHRTMDRVYLSSLMIPFQIIMIAVYKTFKSLDLLNSLFGMIIMLTGYSIAYSTFLYVGFVKSVPKEMEEAALIDGCGPYVAFFRIVFPLLKPISATVAALHVMWLWNDFNIAVILLQRDTVRTLTVKQYYFFGEHTSDYGMAFAASFVCMIPVLLFFILMQRYLVEGISAGAVKS